MNCIAASQATLEARKTNDRRPEFRGVAHTLPALQRRRRHDQRQFSGNILASGMRELCCRGTCCPKHREFWGDSAGRDHIDRIVMTCDLPADNNL